MNFYKLFTVVILLLSFCATTSVVAQTGGRKKEHRNQRGGGLFNHKRSGGHADAFARGGSKKGFFAKLFKGKKSSPSWVYKKTKPGLKQRKEQSSLFSRNRTNGKKYRDGILASQNKRRAASRSAYKKSNR